MNIVFMLCHDVLNMYETKYGVELNGVILGTNMQRGSDRIISIIHE